MKTSKYSYIGIIIGFVVASMVWLTVFSISKNPAFIPLIGSGVVLGFLIRSMFDKKGKKENNIANLRNKAINRLRSQD